LKRRTAALFVTLVVLFASIYMLTYSGRIESGDSLMTFDATGSLVQFGDIRLDLSLWYNLPTFTDLAEPNPLKELEFASLNPPLQPMLAAPLYWLAQNLPGIGLVHTVWLSNILVCAAAVGLLFLYARTVGYSERTALLSAVIFGLGTSLWPYSKTFFRDPLTLLLILLAAFLIERLRLARYRSPVLIVAIALTLVGILATKIAAAFAFPALLILALPDLPLKNRHLLWLIDLALVLLVALPFIVVYTPAVNLLPSYFALFGRFGVWPQFMRTAVQGYLFSIGGSVWGTSPIALLAVPGAWLLYRGYGDRQSRRLVWAIVMMVVIYAFGYGLLTNEHWFGGLSWPPRFMLPVVPFLILGALPILDRLTQLPVSRWLVAIVAVLFVYSLWIQFSAVSLEWRKYADVLPPESGQLIEWGPGLNTLQYLRWVIIPSLWAREPLDFAWLRVNAAGWPLGFAVLALVSAGLLWQIMRRIITKYTLSKQNAIASFGLPLVFTVLTVLGLRAIAADPVYLGDHPALPAMLDILKTETHTGDVVLLNTNKYERFFLNQNRLDARVITLPLQPGEQPSEAQPSQLVSDNPDVLLTDITAPLIYRLAEDRDRLWLLMETGPFLAWSTRPLERFMNMHYYPIHELQTAPPDPTLRLIEYSTAAAPNPYAFRGPENLTDLVYGDRIRLVGYNLPSGNTYVPGDILPLSLYWQTSAPLDTNYTIAWFLADADTGTIAAQGMDTQPASGFVPTSTWRPSIPVWDNRALRLPVNLSHGTFRLWISVYEILTDGTIRELPVTAGEAVEGGKIGVLPTVITVDRLS
jgi:hypothetical protein